jgi:hypothetical protein
MPEDTENPTQTEPQAGDTENPQPQAGATTTTPEPQAGDGKDTSTDAISLEEAKKLRSESANLRKRLKDAEVSKAELAELKKFKEQIDAKDLSDKEKQDRAVQKKEQELAERQSELEKANNRIRDLTINQAVLSQAGKLNIVDPEVAAQIIKADIELDESGNPTNIPDLLKQLVKDKPYLVAQQQTRQAPTRGGPTNPSRSQTSGGQLSQEVIGKMKPEEYASRRPEINEWLAKNQAR